MKLRFDLEPELAERVEELKLIVCVCQFEQIGIAEEILEDFQTVKRERKETRLQFDEDLNEAATGRINCGPPGRPLLLLLFCSFAFGLGALTATAPRSRFLLCNNNASNLFLINFLIWGTTVAHGLVCSRGESVIFLTVQCIDRYLACWVYFLFADVEEI